MKINNLYSLNKKNTKNNNVLLLWDLNYFKIKKCTKKFNHNNIKCVFFHNKNDKRRNINISFYDTIWCDNIDNCDDKNCKYSHNRVEILYHPKFYKKKFCVKFLQNNNCKYNNFCSFAHNISELRINVIHLLIRNNNFFWKYFKTEFCPLGNIRHNKTDCVYSHNHQDFKRSNLTHIWNIKCYEWNNNKFYFKYEDGCSNGFKCQYLHGWKEHKYHPLNFKKLKNSQLEDKDIKKSVYHIKYK